MKKHISIARNLASATSHCQIVHVDIWIAREKIREKLLSRPGDDSKASQAEGMKSQEDGQGGSRQGSRVDSWLHNGPLRMMSSRKKGILHMYEGSYG